MPFTFQQTNNVVLSYLNEPLIDLAELEREISLGNMPMRLSPGYTIRKYLDDLVEKGLLKFYPEYGKEGVYVRINPEENELAAFCRRKIEL